MGKRNVQEAAQTAEVPEAIKAVEDMTEAEAHDVAAGLLRDAREGMAKLEELALRLTVDGVGGLQADVSWMKDRLQHHLETVEAKLATLK